MNFIKMVLIFKKIERGYLEVCLSNATVESFEELDTTAKVPLAIAGPSIATE